MTITVKHNFVSTVPDSTDTSLVKPSDWNADHTLTGVGTAASLDAGVPNGVATLDAGGKVPASQIPMQGDLNYQGSWNASTNTPTLTSSVGTKGYYYVVSVAGSTNLDGITDWQVGDWAIFNGTIWQKVDNTDAVTSVNGYVGAVVLTQPDIAGTVPTSETISTGTGLTGGGDLSAPRTISFSTPAVGTWAATPSSANLAAAMTDETGSGSLVFGTGPTLSAPVIDGANPYIQFNNGSAVTVAAGKLWYDGSTGSWNAGMGGGNITQQIGEELFVYGKASAAITDSPLQIVYKTGVVGASGNITFAPTVAGITNDDVIIGVATESIALNATGRITSFGVIHGITTNGTAYGETWADGDVIWYNPVTGNPTKTKPTAPNVKCQIGTVINAGSGGSGSFQVEIIHGTSLGGTDSNVNIISATNGNILTYDGTNSYWKNTDLTAGTGISVSKSVDGVLTVTNTAPSSGGTVTNVSGTAPISVANGTTTPAVSISQAGSSTDGYLSSTDWNTFNNKQPAGSYLTAVTADAPLSGSGTSASHLSIPAANGSTNGYLTSADWTTFNSKQPAGTYVTSVSGTTGRVTSSGGTTPTIDLASGIVSAGTTGSSTLIPVITVDTYGRVTNVTTAANPQGTVTSVAATVPSFLSVSGSPVTSSGTLAISYSGTALPIANGGTNQTAFTAKSGNVAGLTYFDGTSLANDTSVTHVGYDTTLHTLNAQNFQVNNGIVCNNLTVGTSFSIPSGYGGHSTGPITVASGVTVTVPSGSRWVVL